MSTQTDALQRAIDYLGAVEVCTMDPITASQHALGERTYAYVFQENEQWRTTTQAALEVFPSDEVSRAYWVGAYSKSLPSWWTPETRFAIESLSHDGTGNPCEPREVLRERYFASREEAASFLAEDDEAASIFDCRIITADLETGEEVPA